MKLLQAILIIVGVYLAMRWIVRMYGKSILKWAGNKAMERVKKNFEQRQNASAGPTVKNGETVINDVNTKEKSHTSSSNKTVGEYVDYEEID